ncbi:MULTISPECIES: phytoene/squalene synthase family protein [unclassified Corynebacterium]|uniref:phytoene/squalene synthase family protein n=1 Tax=unclassified Corynebacterium TaxID=2624378 RepID=UPI002A917AA8|nr:phytoene/squalene synthase family protein [Corynebacterium sp.]MDY5786439.1 phytoene/squalene synthase family protein [Corynebacterium sp.]
MCDSAASRVIATYSSSFSLATRVLSAPLRRDIRNLYAMVRIADEIVDGSAAEGGRDVLALLNAYEASVLAAPGQRFHTDPVLHAYAATARRCSFDPEHVRAFFASMRRDTAQSTYDTAEFAEYVYGSAEVIGLLCLQAFVTHHPVPASRWPELEAGARALGSAFQKINFLRDMAEDSGELGRSYFPQLRRGTLTDAAKSDIVADIRGELDHARRVIPLLPGGARAGVAAAEALFRELTDRVDATPADTLLHERVSVPAHIKLFVTARAIRDARKGPQT